MLAIAVRYLKSTFELHQFLVHFAADPRKLGHGSGPGRLHRVLSLIDFVNELEIHPPCAHGMTGADGTLLRVSESKRMATAFGAFGYLKSLMIFSTTGSKKAFNDQAKHYSKTLARDRQASLLANSYFANPDMADGLPRNGSAALGGCYQQTECG